MKALIALVTLVIASTSLGCAREARPIQSGGTLAYPHASYAWPPANTNPFPPAAPPLFAGIGAPPEAAAVAPSADPVVTAPATTPPPGVPAIEGGAIVGGDRCLEELAKQGVSFTRLGEKRGIETPVEIKGAIGGIGYGGSMVCDCRFALALAKVAPVLRDLGVSAARYAGAYSYRLSRVGRLSLHAYGLALDVHEFVIDGVAHSVKRDFLRGADWCSPSSPKLNQLACRLKATGLFRELLTPDYNADHWDHFHLGLAPLAGMPSAPPRIAHPQKPSTAKPAKEPAPRLKPSIASPDELLPPDDEPTVIPDRPDPADTSDEPTVEPDPPPAKRAKKKSHPTAPSPPKKTAHKRLKRSVRGHAARAAKFTGG